MRQRPKFDVLARPAGPSVLRVISHAMEHVGMDSDTRPEGLDDEVSAQHPVEGALCSCPGIRPIRVVHLLQTPCSPHFREYFEPGPDHPCDEVTPVATLGTTPVTRSLGISPENAYPNDSRRVHLICWHRFSTSPRLLRLPPSCSDLATDPSPPGSPAEMEVDIRFPG